MRTVAICAAIVVIALASKNGAVEAATACYKSPSVPATKRVLKPSTKDSLDLCLGKQVKIKGTTYCYQCTGQSFDIGNNTGQCVKSCGAGFIWNAAQKMCCPGIAPPPPVIK
jgi:hypothetical protein